MADKDDPKKEKEVPDYLEPVNAERFRKLELDSDVRPDRTEDKPPADTAQGVPEEKVLEDKVRREEIAPPPPGSLQEAIERLRGREDISPPPPRSLREAIERRMLGAGLPSVPSVERRGEQTDLDRHIESFRQETDPALSPIPPEPRPARERPTPRQEQVPAPTLGRLARIFLVALGIGLVPMLADKYFSNKPNNPTTISSPSQISDDSLVDILPKLAVSSRLWFYDIKYITKDELREKPEFSYRARNVLYEFFRIHSLPPTVDSIDTFKERYPFLRPANFFLFFDRLDQQTAPFRNRYNWSPQYVGEGRAGAVAIIDSEYLLPTFRLSNEEYFPYFDRNAARALAEKKGKFITKTQFAALQESTSNPYWHLQALERSGDLESLIALPGLSNPVKAWELQKKHCAEPGQTMYAWCGEKYDIQLDLHLVPDIPVLAAGEACLLFSAEQGKQLILRLKNKSEYRSAYNRIKGIQDLDGSSLFSDDKKKLDPNGDGCLDELDKDQVKRTKQD